MKIAFVVLFDKLICVFWLTNNEELSVSASNFFGTVFGEQEILVKHKKVYELLEAKKINKSLGVWIIRVK